MFRPDFTFPPRASRWVLSGLLLGASAMFFSVSVKALPRNNDDDPSGFCESDIEVEELVLRTTGSHLPGATVIILADQPRIRAKTPLPRNPHVCEVRSKLVPSSNWSWQIISQPAHSTSQLAVTGGLAATLLFDQPGSYKVRFTACAFGCSIELPDHTMASVDPRSAEVLFQVVAILPPGQTPILPPQRPASPTDVSVHCAFDADHFSAAWRTVEPWSGPSDYKLLEGVVDQSQVSSTDNNLNHDSMDWGIHVIPDPQYRGLLGSGSDQSQVEVEWERSHFLERARPTVGDRISAWGYWIYDCGHDAKTEIHPPVLVAVHRPRAIALPTDAGAGSNVYVPGIITDIWVNREAGATTDDCHGTGLHQQIHPSKPLVDGQGHFISRCLPDSEGFSHNPINRVFEFNIYLPRSPQAMMAAIGKTAPPVPLYRKVSNPGNSAGPDPTFEEMGMAEGVPYLKVRIDLSAYTQSTYSRRIVAGWAHAAPDNWGARRWNVRVTSLDISDDGDGLTSGDGDWRFWVNTNNGASEWAKLFDCDGCAHGNENFGGTPWETNATAADRNLGSSIVLFPSQLIRLATSGFEDDSWFEESIAPVSLRLGQMQISDGRKVANDGVGKYTLHYQVQPGEEVGPAVLSPSAKARYDAYSLTRNNLDWVNIEAAGFLDAVFNARIDTPGSRPHGSGEKEPREPLSLEGISVKRLRQSMLRAAREKPAQLDAFFQDVHRVIKREKSTYGDKDMYQFLETMKTAVPAALWRKHGFEAELRALRENKESEDKPTSKP